MDAQSIDIDIACKDNGEIGITIEGSLTDLDPLGPRTQLTVNNARLLLSVQIDGGRTFEIGAGFDLIGASRFESLGDSVVFDPLQSFGAIEDFVISRSGAASSSGLVFVAFSSNIDGQNVLLPPNYQAGQQISDRLDLTEKFSDLFVDGSTNRVSWPGSDGQTQQIVFKTICASTDDNSDENACDGLDIISRIFCTLLEFFRSLFS